MIQEFEIEIAKQIKELICNKVNELKKKMTKNGKTNTIQLWKNLSLR